MAQNPFGRVIPGQPMDGIPAVVWNQMLEVIQGRLEAFAGKRGRTSTEPGVLNNTGSPLTTRFAVLQVGDPVPLQSENDSEFAESRVLKGTTPAAGSPFAVLWEPASAGQIVPSTLLGITPVRISVGDAGHSYADCTTATDKLTSGATGSARILWVESDDPGPRATGDQWAVVNLLGQAAGGSGGGGLTHVFGQLNDVSSGGSTGGNNAITTGTLAAGEYVVSARTTATGVTPGGAGVLGSVGLAISASVSATINPSAGGRATAFTNTASANAYGTVSLTARVLLDSSGTITVTGDCFWQTSVGWSSRTELEVWSNP
jgi:hypothetical protein